MPLILSVHMRPNIHKIVDTQNLGFALAASATTTLNRNLHH